MKTKYRFSILWYTDQYGWDAEPYNVRFPGDIYIEFMQIFGEEDYAMDALVWAEQAKSGDIYEDENVRIFAL